MKKILIILLFLFPTNLFSFEKTTNFTFQKFKNAQEQNKTIVINSWNKYCGTCKTQSKIFTEAINDFKNVEFLFYEQTKHKEIANSLNIKYWSTIIVFKGKNEIAREIGLVTKEDIYRIINKAI
tara:strand:+ start:462 stop:833 length:372 start_codon:yes stop_codon:yes gene_type:complete